MEKTYTLYAGVNGAGKSTLYKISGTVSAGQRRVNSDEVLKEQNGDWKNRNAQARAMKESVENWQRATPNVNGWKEL